MKYEWFTWQKNDFKDNLVTLEVHRLDSFQSMHADLIMSWGTKKARKINEKQSTL